MVRLVSLCQMIFGLVCFIQGMLSQISTIFRSGDVMFMWTPSPNALSYDVNITRDITQDWICINETQYTVRNALLYDVIKIELKASDIMKENTLIYKVSKVQTQIGDTVNISWTAAFFPIAGLYNIYHTYRIDERIIHINSEGISYGDHYISNKYRYITTPYNSVNISFEIRNIDVDDAGYYVGGPTSDFSWSGGGVVLIVSGKPLKPIIKGNLSIMVDTFSEITCYSESTSVPDYYSKLVILTYTWFLNETEIDEEMNQTLNFKVSRGQIYNSYSCTATEEDLVSERSDSVRINPLYGPETLNITPQPILNLYDQITVRRGDTLGPFNCSADCNPPCNISWQVEDSTGFYDVVSETGMLLHQVVMNTELLCCVANWVDDTTTKELIKLDVQYLEEPRLYINDTLNYNVDVTENTSLRISCFVDGNPAPTIRLSRGQCHTDTELEKIEGKWLNYTIESTQCSHTDTYKCTWTSSVFGSSYVLFYINILCNPRIDISENVKSTYSFKSGIDSTLEVAIPLIANPPPRTSNWTWNGPYTVPMKSVISQRDVIYKQRLISHIPVVDQSYFGNYSLQFRDSTIYTITIIAEDVPKAPTNFTGSSYASGCVNLTWVSSFSGGPCQFFILSLNDGSKWEKVVNLSDPGEGNLVHYDLGFLTPGKQYLFSLESCNRINCTFPAAEIIVQVKDCAAGLYGRRCKKMCGKCKNGTACNTSSGMCPNGCQDHWTPPLCADCEPYKYGINCSFGCGHCKDEKPCSTVSGSCIDGCEDGWTGAQCDAVWSNGTYVSNGECSKCQVVCRDNTLCNKSISGCINDCSDHQNGKVFTENGISKTNTIVIFVLAILLGITWLLLTIFTVYKIRGGCLANNNTSIYLDTQHVMNSYQNLQGIEAETNYTSIDRPDQEIQYVELNIS